MTKKQPWFKFRANDWLSDPHLRQCTAEEKGVLIEMMAYAHKSSEYGYLINGGIILDDATLAHSLNIDIDRFKEMVQRLVQLGRLTQGESGVYCVPSMVRDFASAEAAAFYGSQGGNPNIKGGVKGGDKLRTEQNREEQKRVTEAFEMFWKAYPRKVAKKKAMDSFIKQGCYGKLREILAAVAEQNASQQWSENDGKYIPHPTTWLNQHRWEDVLQPAKKRGMAI